MNTADMIAILDRITHKIDDIHERRRSGMRYVGAIESDGAPGGMYEQTGPQETDAQRQHLNMLEATMEELRCVILLSSGWKRDGADILDFSKKGSLWIGPGGERTSAWYAIQSIPREREASVTRPVVGHEAIELAAMFREEAARLAHELGDAYWHGVQERRLVAMGLEEIVLTGEGWAHQFERIEGDEMVQYWQHAEGMETTRREALRIVCEIMV